jgi:hypothetical protein
VIDAGSEAEASATPDAAPNEASTPDASPAIDSSATDAGTGSESSSDPHADASAGNDAETSDVSLNDDGASSDAGQEATVTVEASSEAGEDAAQEAQPTGPTVRYDFENGIQGWEAEAALSIVASAVHADSGAQSLAVTMNNADYSSISIPNPPSGLSSGRFTFRIYIPTGTTLSVIQPFDMTSWDPVKMANSWKGQWIGGDTMAAIPRDVWQTVSVEIPTVDTEKNLDRVDPFAVLGIQFQGSGTVYIDNVSW